MLKFIEAKDVPLIEATQPWRLPVVMTAAAIDTSPPAPKVGAVEVGLLLFVIAAGAATMYIYAKHPA